MAHSQASFAIIDNSGDTSQAVATGQEKQFNPLNLDSYTACGYAEGFVDCPDEAHYIAAWQYLIDTGICWTMQGWYGRTARDLIDAGVCHIEQNATYYPTLPLPEFCNEE